ncbi:site-2 protease family protein [Clostridium sp.]|uniref:site-2 protease family protein n=1 Tax=Clostridium sp. TaxID=1506 RepID=UPI002FC5EACE
MDFFIIYIVLFMSIFIHELGHYVTSKIFKVPVYQFSIGVGPKVFSVFMNGTEFEVRIFPLGGYIYNDEAEYNSLNLLKIYSICLSGVIVNFIAFFLSLLVALNCDFNLLQKTINHIYLIITQSIRRIDMKSIYILQNSISNLLYPIKGLSFLFAMIIVNLTLALTNLLPFSSLDGNKVWVATIERLLQKLKLKGFS